MTQSRKMTFIIGEIGINHNGSMILQKKLIWLKNVVVML